MTNSSFVLAHMYTNDSATFGDISKTCRILSKTFVTAYLHVLLLENGAPWPPFWQYKKKSHKSDGCASTKICLDWLQHEISFFDDDEFNYWLYERTRRTCFRNRFRISLKKHWLTVYPKDFQSILTLRLEPKKHLRMQLAFDFDITEFLVKQHCVLSLDHDNTVQYLWVDLYLFQHNSCQMFPCVSLLLWQIFEEHFSSNFSLEYTFWQSVAGSFKFLTLSTSLLRLPS